MVISLHFVHSGTLVVNSQGGHSVHLVPFEQEVNFHLCENIGQ